MTRTSANSNFINNSARCAHIFANGRRCRLYSTNPDSHFCPSHARLPQNQPDTADVAASLTAGLDDLSSGEEIAIFLSRLLLLTARGKISPRRAAVLTYIASQLLHSVRTIIVEEKHSPNTEIIFDAPRPDRSKYNAAREGTTENKSDAGAAAKLEVVAK